MTGQLERTECLIRVKVFTKLKILNMSKNKKKLKTSHACLPLKHCAAYIGIGGMRIEDEPRH